MQSDRELLELAARAALGRTSIPDQHMEMVRRGWNPLEDDAAAIRLAVRLYMTVQRKTDRAIAHAEHPMCTSTIEVPFLAEDQGEFIGVRRAIVLAAAEIGAAQAHPDHKDGGRHG
ncbi:hypothetical protein [Achromobacter sp. MFA1 R4]|uniref:hypothetical protein n=1 Tax=Achromobacter sp. MFA1 R4 TaxID=1881016 RepID=UPI0009536DEF|nr:hypothetical protein [Achromobacter sp. MFA1 R4]SIT25245.1 hypothetical protein SAMN05428937_2981 [Achromobacter sp. MFA1 R4]